MKSVIVIPTYNEAQNIKKLIGRILFLGIKDLHVLVVDDNSPDGTGYLVDRLAKTFTVVHPVHRSRKLGLGTAYVAGFRYSLDLNVDFVITMDADFSHHPQYVPILLEAGRNYDVVIGSRYVDGGETRCCSLWRRLLSRSANTFTWSMLGLQPRDCTSKCVRALSRSVSTNRRHTKTRVRHP